MAVNPVPGEKYNLSPFLERDVSSWREWEQSAFDEATAAMKGRIVLYGAGSIGRLTIRVLRENGLEPLAVADVNSGLWGTALEGVPVISPSSAAERYGKTSAFVVSVWNRSHRTSDTFAWLARLGCTCVVSCAALFYKYHEGVLPYYSLDLPHRIIEHSKAIYRAFDLMADEESQRTFFEELRWRFTLDFEGILPRPVEEQYFPFDLFDLKENEVFVDCGAYDGDTLQQFISLSDSRFGKIIAIEPDPHNHEKLLSFVQGLPEQTRSRIQLHRTALGAQGERVRFSADAQASSRIAPDAAAEVESRPLNDILDKTSPTFIKMDIEGAELDALKGGERVIRESGAIFAVCVYHSPFHLWEIPFLLASLPGQYRFFLRRYQEVPWEVVLYAVPANRLKRKNGWEV